MLAILRIEFGTSRLVPERADPNAHGKKIRLAEDLACEFYPSIRRLNHSHARAPGVAVASR